MSTLPRPGSLRPHRSSAPFHALFASIAERTDISPAAKLLYAALVSVHRKTHAPAPTQVEIGAMIGLSRHQVWRAQAELVAAELLTVRRRGQGLPNEYELQGVDQRDLDGAGHQEPRRSIERRSWSPDSKKTRRMDDVVVPPIGYDIGAYRAHERATYAEQAARYGVRR